MITYIKNLCKNLPFLLVLSLITCCMETDLSVPSFPDISDHFDISNSLTQMIIAVNFLGFCVSSLMYGPLSDSYGRRYVMLVGNAIMTIGACMCVLAQNIEFLLVSRFIQGLGASTSAVVAFAMIADVYSSEKSAKIVGQMNSMITIFMSSAPIIGGVINKYIGWRGNFSSIAFVSVVSFTLLYFYLPETSKRYKVFSVKDILSDFKLLITDKRFILASVLPSVQFAGWMSFVACGAFLYRETYQLSIMQYAMHQGAIIAVFSFISLKAGDISAMVGATRCVILGIGFMVLSGILLVAVALSFNNAPYLTSISMIINGLGVAISYPIIFAKSLEIFPDIRGAASSMLMGVRSLICASTIAFASYFYNGSLFVVAIFILIAAIIAATMLKYTLNLINFG